MTTAARSERLFAKRAGIRHACDYAQVLVVGTSDPELSGLSLFSADLPPAHAFAYKPIANDRAVSHRTAGYVPHPLRERSVAVSDSGKVVQMSNGQELGPLSAGRAEAPTAPAVHACVEHPR